MRAKARYHAIMDRDIHSVRNITIPLGEHLQSGRISEDEARSLLALAVPRRAGIIIRNVLVIFGAMLMTAGFLALKPDKNLGGLLAVLVLSMAYFLHYRHREAWGVVAQSFGVLGALGIAAWLIIHIESGIIDEEFQPLIWAMIAVLFGTISFSLNSRFIGALVPLCVGTVFGKLIYNHCETLFCIAFGRHPALDVFVYVVLVFVFFRLSRWLPVDKEKIVIIMARVSLFMVNTVFMIGSFSGDYIRLKDIRIWEGSGNTQYVSISDTVFSWVWVFVLVASIIWGTRVRSGFVVNISLVFLSILAFEQYIDVFEGHPVATMIGGFILFGGALAWWKLKDRIKALYVPS